MAINGKDYGWSDIEVRLFGIKLTGIQSIDYRETYTLFQLEEKLKAAEEAEHYELCGELKIVIDKIKNQL